jgi:hypothetical protein
MIFKNHNDGLVLFLMVLIGLSAACASSTTDGKHVLDDGSQLPAPHLVLVRDYDVSSDVVELDSSVGAKASRHASGKDSVAEQSELGRSIAEAIAGHLVSDIQKQGLAAERSTGELPKTGGPFLVIRGELLAVDEGNRLRRAAIGLGAGGTKVAAKTRVALLEDGKETPIEEFTVTGKSSKRPGGALTMGAGGIADVSHDMDHLFDDTPSSHHSRNAAIAAVSTKAAVAAGSKMSDTIGDSVQADAARGARAIAEELSKLFQNHDWIEVDK